jgi:hypothetical protein
VGAFFKHVLHLHWELFRDGRSAVAPRHYGLAIHEHLLRLRLNGEHLGDGESGGE